MSADTDTSDVPPVSEHARDRWHERTDASAPEPTTAWRHTQRISVSHPSIYAEEVRLHRPTGTLLLYTPPSITTVLTVDEASDDQYHAIKHALPETITQ